MGTGLSSNWNGNLIFSDQTFSTKISKVYTDLIGYHFFNLRKIVLLLLLLLWLL